MSLQTPATSTTVFPVGTWQSDDTHSSAGFAIRAVGTFRGIFETVTATLTVAEDGSAELSGVVAAESIHVKNGQMRAHLGSPDFFDIARYPELRFASTSLRREGDEVRLEGLLTIRDQTHPILAHGKISETVTALDGASRLGMAFETVIDRTDYGVSWNAPLPSGRTAIGDEVTITVDLDFVLEAGEAA